MIMDGFQDLGFASLGKGVAAGIKCALVFFCALLLAYILTPCFRTLMRRLSMVDQPGERRINKEPIPRGGGVSVFLAFHLALAAFVFLGGEEVSGQFSLSWQYAFLIGSSVLVGIGFIDDKFGMKPLIKLIGQIAVASLLFFSGVHVGGILVTFPWWLDYLVTVFWIVGAVNAFNLIDGMDGLASGLALIASVGLAGTLFFAGSFENIIPYAALGGACLGFLRYNFHPATVFLGDTGSMFLGLCVATLPLVSGSRLELIPSLIVPLLAMGIPIFDTLLAIWRRVIRRQLAWTASAEAGEPRVQIMGPDKEHLHHRVLLSVKSQRVAAWGFYGASTVLVAVGLLAMLFKKQAPGVFLIAFSVAVIVIVKHLARTELWDTGRLVAGRHVRIRKRLIVPLYVLADLTILTLVWMLAQWVLYWKISASCFLTQMPMYVGSVFVLLVLARTYQRVWQRAQFSDFAPLLFSVFFGVALGSGLITICYNINESTWRFSLVFATFALVPLVAIRLLVQTFLGIMQMLKRHVLLQNKDVKQILVYGAGLRFRNYMREQTIRVAIADRAIIGIIDDDFQLLGRMIHGYKVLGELNDIPNICQKSKVDSVVITCMLPSEQQDILFRMAEEHGFKVSIWLNEERELVQGKKA